MKLKKILSSLAALTACAGLLSPNAQLVKLSQVSAAGEGSTNYYSYDTFEESAGTWETRSSDSAKVTDNDAYSGSKSLLVTGRSSSWNGCQMPLDSEIFKAGSSYAFSVAACSVKSSQMMLSLQYSAGDETFYDHIASSYSMNGKWTVMANSEYTIPEGATDLILYVETISGTSDFMIDEAITGKTGCVVSSFPESNQLGDINGDSKVGAIDYALLKNCLINSKLSPAKTADVNSDSVVDVKDAVLMQQYLLGIIEDFPEPPEPVDPPQSDFEYNAALPYHDMPASYKSDCSEKGTVVKANYTTGNFNKYANVYLPYGYDQNDTTHKYNVFYLMHGGGENQDTIFSDDVNFKRILDNMIMNGDIEPMIVVTPTFNGAGSDMNANAKDFHTELVNDVIPLIEGKYNTYAKSTSKEDLKASRYHRAFGGFSMGGLTTWFCFLNTLDYIAYYMPLSGDCWAGNTADEKAAAVADAVKKSGYSPDEYFIFAATGTSDIAYDALSKQVEAMKKLPDQFIFTSDFSKGNFYFLTKPGATHWWGNVVHYIYDALPYFFHES